MQRVEEVKEKVTQIAEDMEQVVNKIVDPYFKELDEAVKDVKYELTHSDRAEIKELEYYVNYIPTLLYFAEDSLENIGIRLDVSKAAKKEKFNNCYLTASGKTVQERTSQAEMEVIENDALKDIYERAYKKAESKIEKAEMIVSSIKRVMQYRISELEINGINVTNGTNFKNNRRNSNG